MRSLFFLAVLMLTVFSGTDSYSQSFDESNYDALQYRLLGPLGEGVVQQ